MGFLIIIKLKWRILKNKIFYLRRESTLKILVIIFFITGYGVGSFLLLYNGFDYINQTLGVGYFLIDRLVYVFFMVLSLMLLASQLIITYSGFYRNDEVEYLFSLPVSNTSIYVVKFLESTFLSSWAFIFLALPLFLAYGAGRHLGLNFYAVVMCISVPFVFISAGAGTALGALLVRYFPRKFAKIIVISGITLAIGLFIYYKKAKQEFNWQTGDLGLVMDQLLWHTKVSLYPLLPSYWVSRGIFSAVSGDWHDVIFYFLVLLSSGIFFVWFCVKLGGRIYFTGWQILKAGQKTKYYYPHNKMEWLNKMKSWQLVSKDLKQFLRDPVQWSQFTIFFGMIGVYIFNLRNMQYDIDSVFWKNFISCLNMATIALTLGTLCTRFIYPQMSIECRRMWIIGLTPIGIGRVLFIKYIVSVCLCSIITVGLMAGSNIMLRVPLYMAWLSIGTMLVMSISLPGMALGLGAVFPNIKEDDMAKIVAGFGGTLTLVLSLTYIVCILALEIMPVHLYFAKQIITHDVFLKWIISACIVGAGISALVAFVPLLWGHKCLLKIEV